MKHYQIISTKTGKILFAGLYADFNHCLEDAVLPHADFSGANLSGTNLSEAYLKGAKFAGAALFNTCLSYSNLRACDFRNASFGATDIVGTILSQAQFSTLSCFSLDFSSVRQMDSCLFIDHDGRFSEMSKPPVVIKGIGNKPIILTDHDIRAGHNVIDEQRTLNLMQKISMREIRKRMKSFHKRNEKTNLNTHKT